MASAATTVSNPTIDRLILAGLDSKGASLACQSKTVAAFIELLNECNITSDRNVTILLQTFLAKYPSNCPPIARQSFISSITSHSLKSTAQLDAGLKYVKHILAEGLQFDVAEFERSAGVGVVVTKEQVVDAVTSLIERERATLLSARYRHAPKLLGTLIAELNWADGGLIKTVLDQAILDLIGPKTDDDNKKVKVKPVAAATPAASSSSSSTTDSKSSSSTASTASAVESAAEIDWLELLQGRDMPEARNSAAILAAHREATKGSKVVTRFPPEPNGYLHIGHAKAMNFNFGLATKYGGECIMRFDDTNPVAEKGEYIDNILENLNWLGHKPSRITYSSDNFEELYRLAVVLIKKGKAYIDHQTAAEISSSRETKIPSPYRDRPIAESVALFEDMRRGKFEEGTATLRMKGDMNAANPQMWDLVAYRIKYAEHPHCGAKWCIYPSYDYTHCICDSIENITHSCCTLEFEARRESYYWLLHELDLYKPNVWEFSRLQLEYTVMSKRCLLRLVEEKYVTGWDDPRLSTLNGFRRRGYPAEAIKLFCDTIGVTRNENFIAMALLEFCCRSSLEPLATRAMVVVNPIKIVLTNYDVAVRGESEELFAPNFPKDLTKGNHSITFSRTVYISADDFSAVDAGKDFFGLSVGKEIHLKHAYNIRADAIIYEADGVTVKEVHATADFTNKNKPKGKIHWVADLTSSTGVPPLAVELRLYDNLFCSKDPRALPGEEWLGDLNPNSLIITKALADPSIKNAKAGDFFQFERVAFFVCDKDSTSDMIVFNRTVTLKASK